MKAGSSRHWQRTRQSGMKSQKIDKPHSPPGTRHLSVNAAAPGDTWQLHSMPTCECVWKKGKGHLTASIMSSKTKRFENLLLCVLRRQRSRGETLWTWVAQGHQRARLEERGPNQLDCLVRGTALWVLPCLHHLLLSLHLPAPSAAQQLVVPEATKPARWGTPLQKQESITSMSKGSHPREQLTCRDSSTYKSGEIFESPQ